MAYQSTVLADEPAFFWRCSDASGPGVTDASGNDRTGTAQGGVTFAAGGLLRADASRALTLDGVAPQTAADAYRASVLADAPLAYFPLSETPAGAGTPYADASGHGYDGTLIAAPDASAGSTPGPLAPQTAPDFGFFYDTDAGQAESDCVLVTHTAGLPASGDAYTIEAWVKPQAFADGTVVDVDDDDPPYPWSEPVYARTVVAWGPLDYDGYFLDLSLSQTYSDTDVVGSLRTIATDYTATIGTTWQASTLSVVTADPVYDGAWHHLVLTDDGAGTLTLYLDGAQIGQATGQPPNGVIYGSGNRLAIGDANFVPGSGDGWPTPAEQLYRGGLAHAAIYPTALSGARVAAHYAAVAMPTPSGGTMVVQDATSTLPAGASIEVWLRTTTTQGGVLAQFATADATQRDLTLYLRSDGVPAFRAGDTEIVRSSDRTVADGRIHHLVATLDADAAAWLYVDGSVAAHVEGVTPASPFTGRWQVGAGTTDDLAVPPASAAYAGVLDEVAIYVD